jgi:hypothetical protein
MLHLAVGINPLVIRAKLGEKKYLIDPWVSELKLSTNIGRQLKSSILSICGRLQSISGTVSRLENCTKIKFVLYHPTRRSGNMNICVLITYKLPIGQNLTFRSKSKWKFFQCQFGICTKVVVVKWTTPWCYIQKTVVSV